VRAIKLTAARGFLVALHDATRRRSDVGLAGGVLIRTAVREVSPRPRRDRVRVMNLDEAIPSHGGAGAERRRGLSRSPGPGPSQYVEDLLGTLAPETMNFESIKKHGTP